MMFDVKEKPQIVENAFLICAFFNKKDKSNANVLLDELVELVKNLEIGIAERFLSYVRNINSAFLLSKGKKEHVLEKVKDLKCDCIIFDNELSPAQQRNWEKESGVCVIDRQEVILDIFSRRAFTREARLQVGLARMQYSLPRLKRMWAHLDRQIGGIGVRGEGETQLEIDRRLANIKISKIKQELKKVRQQRNTKRKSRVRSNLPSAAIIGYTNAGKSTLLNSLTQAKVYVKDELFATLDPSTRKFTLPDGQEFYLTDTVGFVQNLPHNLIEAFKATLEEAIFADILILVIDGSAKNFMQMHETTLSVLKELGVEENAKDKNFLIVINKIDKIGQNDQLNYIKAQFPQAVFISAKKKLGFKALIAKISQLLSWRIKILNLKIPQNDVGLLDLIYRHGKLISKNYDKNDLLVKAAIPINLFNKFAKYVKKK